jgi:predicted RND superfamily exporter protein
LANTASPNRLHTRLAKIIADQPRRILLVALAFTALAVVGVRQLRVDDVPRNIYTVESEEFAALQKLFDGFGSDDNECIVVLVADDWFQPSTAGTLREITGQIRRVPGVASVRSMVDAVVFPPGAPPRPLMPADGPTADWQRAATEAAAHPLVGGNLLSDDLSTALVAIRFDLDKYSVRAMAPIVKSIHRIAHEATADRGITAMVTGFAAIRVEIFEAIPQEQLKFTPIGALVGVVICLFLFRRISSMAIVIGVAGIGAFWALGAMGLSGEKLNILNSVLPSLVLVVGVADAVHLLLDIRESRHVGLDNVTASRRAVVNLGPACLLTSFTTAVGFSSLAVANVPMIRHLGIACAAGVVLTLLAVLFLVPTVSRWQGKVMVEAKPNGRPDSSFNNMARAWSRFISRRAKWVTVVGIVTTVVLIYSSFQLRPSSRMAESIPPDHESARGLKHCDEILHGAYPLSVLVHWSDGRPGTGDDVRAALADVEEVLRRETLLSEPVSLLNLLASLPDDESMRQMLWLQLPADIRDRFVREDLHKALVTVRVPDIGTGLLEPVVDRLTAGLAALESRHPGMTFELTGTLVVAVKQLTGMIRDLAMSLMLAAIVIFGVMSLTLRSIRLGILTVLPNVFPLALTAACLVWAGQPLQFTSVIVFSVCLGVAVDDTIHFVMRFRRECAAGYDKHEAMSRTFVSVGRALLTTTAVLLGGFGAPLASSMPSIQLFALLACLAMVAALIGDLLFLPALLMTFSPPAQEARPAPG